MPPLPAFERLLVAILIGLLIGLDRERTKDRKEHRLFAGVRTFPLIALAGAIPVLLMNVTGPTLLIVSFVSVAAMVAVAYYLGSASGDFGATTEMAALATFLLGALAGAGQLLVAAGAAVAVATLLVAKLPLESFSRALSQEEIAATLELAVISVIILPLVPNQGYGPWGVLNPFEIWLVVVLVSALSFAGFIATRLLGQRQGLLVTGALGSLVSSTAVTVAMATQARANRQLAPVAAAAAVIASTIMSVRVAVLAAAVNVAILPPLLPTIVAMSVTGGAATWILVRLAAGSKAKPTGAALDNPFSLTGALTFGIIYGLVLLVSRAGREYFGTGGLYAAAALSALADVDAVSIAYARMGADIGWQVPAVGIAIAMITNTLVKLGIAVVMGTGPFRRYVAIALAVMALAGAAGAIAMALF